MAEYQYTVTPEEAAHYDTIRQQRDWSWATLADYFDNNCSTDPASPFLAEWARSQADTPTAKRAAKKGTERATTDAPEKR